MVTLESGAEQVYAKNEKIKSDTSGGTALEKENFSDEKEYVLIETDGNEGGMIINSFSRRSAALRSFARAVALMPCARR